MYRSLMSSLQAPSAALPEPSPSKVVVCDEESRGSTSASSPSVFVTVSNVPVNVVDLIEGRGRPKDDSFSGNEIPRGLDYITTPKSDEGHDVSSVLSSASPPPSLSCNLGQSDVSRAALEDGDIKLLFNPHEQNRFDSWRESLFQELVLTQGYFYEIDSTQIMDCEVGRLTHTQKCLIDNEYLKWMEGEAIASPHKKGANKQSRRREARREKVAGPAAAGGRRARRMTQYARVQGCSVRTVHLAPNRYCRAIGFTR